MLDKTPESLLDCKEVNSVNPKGNHSQIFTGSSYAEAKAPIFWPSDSLEKTLMLGKIQDRRRRG